MRDLLKMPVFRDAPFVASCLCVSPIFELWYLRQIDRLGSRHAMLIT